MPATCTDDKHTWVHSMQDGVVVAMVGSKEDLVNAPRHF